MIKRRYFYNLSISTPEGPRFSCGILITQSWFADPNKAFGRLLDLTCEEWKCGRGKVLCKAFNRV